MEVVVKVQDEMVFVKSPYNEDFVARAKKTLAGKWDGKLSMWTFAKTDEMAVRSLCQEIYGGDGSSPIETVTLAIHFGDEKPEWRTLNDAIVTVAGFTMARRYARDSKVTVFPGVSVAEGPDLPKSGGSTKYPVVDGSKEEPHRVFWMRDFPLSVAERLCADFPGVYEIAQRDKPQTPSIDREDLKQERLSLLARVAEIDALLSAH